MTEHSKCDHDCIECPHKSVDRIGEEVWCDLKEKQVGSVVVEYGETWWNIWETEDD